MVEVLEIRYGKENVVQCNELLWRRGAGMIQYNHSFINDI